MNFKARREGIIVKELGEDLVVYDERADQVHELNRAAASVWRRCDGETPVSDMVARLSDDTELPGDESVVQLALAQLSRAGLLEEATPAAAVPAVSRRAIMRRLGLTGAAALMLPVVTTVLAPTPAMAQSGLPPTTGAPTPAPTTAAPTPPPPTAAPTPPPPTPAPPPPPPPTNASGNTSGNGTASVVRWVPWGE